MSESHELSDRAKRLKTSFLRFAGEAVGLGLEAGKVGYDQARSKYGEYKNKQTLNNYHDKVLKQPDTGEFFPSVPGTRFTAYHRVTQESYDFVSLENGGFLNIANPSAELSLSDMRDYTRYGIAQ